MKKGGRFQRETLSFFLHAYNLSYIDYLIRFLENNLGYEELDMPMLSERNDPSDNASIINIH